MSCISYGAVLFLSLVVFAASAEASCEPGPREIAIFQHANFREPCAVLGIGFHTMREMGIPDNSLSSIKVGSQVRATLFEHDYRRGLEANYEPGFDYSYIGDRANDEVSSIEVVVGKVATWYVGQHPNHRSNFWSREAQGLAHSDSHWFITTQLPEPLLWKIPIDEDLSSKRPPGGSIASRMPPQLRAYNHFGDPDFYRGMIFVPVEGKGVNPVVVAFKASDLRLVGWDYLFGQASAGWIAIDVASGRLYSSPSRITNGADASLLSYPLNVGKLCPNGPATPDCWLLDGNPDKKTLINRDGTNVDLRTMQGGAFQPGSSILYLSNGSAECVGGDRQGVRAFDMSWANETVGRLVARSNGVGFGNFRVQVACGAFKWEELEGLDFGAASSPNISGVLHVMMLDNDPDNKDEVYLKHYDF